MSLLTQLREASQGKESDNSSRIEKLQKDIHSLSECIDSIEARHECFGRDRKYNEYYYFKFDPFKIYRFIQSEKWGYF